MNAKRYLARNAREALKRIKDELGPDAVILSNRSVDGGVEILAAPPEALMQTAALASSVKPATQTAPAAQSSARQSMAPSRVQAEYATDDFQVSLSSSAQPNAAQAKMTQPKMAQDFINNTGAFRSFQPRQATPEEARNAFRSDAAPVAAPNMMDATVEAYDMAQPAAMQSTRRVVQPAAQPTVAPSREALANTVASVDAAFANVALNNQHANQHSNQHAGQSATGYNSGVMDELAALRALVEQQLCGFAWGQVARETPAKSQLTAELLEAGFSAELTRRLMDGLVSSDTAATARNELKTLIGRQLRTLDAQNDIVDRGGVYALVGPTGVGKTTTTAKLAARCVVRHGADSVALITTDGYRIGAHEQLRIYGRILGVPVHVVRDTQDLQRSLLELGNRHMVLIDTVGMSQRDRMVAEQAAMLSASGRVARLLLLNSTTRSDTLDDVVRAYAGPDLAGAIMTKVDEAAGLGPVLDVLLRHELPLYYVANGQRVPEDLHLPNRPYLLHRSLKRAESDSPHHLQDHEAGLLMAASRQRLTAGHGGL